MNALQETEQKEAPLPSGVNERNGDVTSVVLTRSSWVGSHEELVLVLVGDPKSALLVKIAGGIYLNNRQPHGF
jgi:hypothetical protein